jgi:hypothetical protein
MCVTGGRRRCLTGAGACREDAVAIDQRGRFECFHSQIPAGWFTMEHILNKK